MSDTSHNELKPPLDTKHKIIEVPRDKIIPLAIELNRVGWSFYLATPVELRNVLGKPSFKKIKKIMENSIIGRGGGQRCQIS